MKYRTSAFDISVRWFVTRLYDGFAVDGHVFLTDLAKKRSQRPLWYLIDVNFWRASRTEIAQAAGGRNQHPPEGTTIASKLFEIKID